MSNLMASMATAGNALDVYQQALNVVQNNITNSSTPGYATQTLNMVAQPLDVASGLAGGVAAQGLESSRDEYAEEEVYRQLQSLGTYESQSSALSSIDNLFDVTGTSGIPADLNNLFSSFSAWAASPDSASAQQMVIANAGNLATDVQSLSASLAQVSGNVESQIGSTVTQINQLASTIQQCNVEQLQQQGSSDPANDATLHSALDSLSELVDVSVVNQPDGTVSVLMNGGSPLVLGTTQYAISSGQSVPSGAANPQAPPSAQILDSQGNDITSQIQGGNLGGLLDVQNNVLASLVGSGQQVGSLNQFAKALADTVNGILQSGTVSTDSGAAQGAALFTYDSSDPTAAAGSLALNPAITPGELAPVDAQGNANSNANQLASLASSTSAGGVNGLTFGDFFSGIASYVGQQSSTASTNQQAQQQVVTQTEALRDQASGVSLDDQAVALLGFQKGYEATAQLLTTLNDIATATIDMITE
jgi:flagellar hook-associated protein 1 FlgK